MVIRSKAGKGNDWRRDKLNASTRPLPTQQTNRDQLVPTNCEECTRIRLSGCQAGRTQSYYPQLEPKPWLRL